MELIIKSFDELTPLEVYGILKLRCAAFIVEQKCRYVDEDDKDIGAVHVFGREGDGRIVACLRILDKHQRFDEISIGRVVVDAAFRHKGIAREMMRTALAHIRATAGQEPVRISAQAHLEAFYGSLGFARCSDTYLEEGIPHVEMLAENA